MLGLTGMEYKPIPTKSPITSLTDERLVKITPNQEGFYDLVLFCQRDNGLWDKYSRESFIEGIQQISTLSIPSFYVPTMSPTIGNESVPFDFKMNGISESRSPISWLNVISQVEKVEDKKWQIASPIVYDIFLVYCINQLIKDGNSFIKAYNSVVTPDDYDCKKKVDISTIYDGLQYPRLLFYQENSRFFYTAPSISLAQIKSLSDIKSFRTSSITPFLILI